MRFGIFRRSRMYVGGIRHKCAASAPLELLRPTNRTHEPLSVFHDGTPSQMQGAIHRVALDRN